MKFQYEFVSVRHEELPSGDLIKSIQDMIDSRMGDNARLQYILKTLQSGKSLLPYDQTYLESLLSRSIIQKQDKTQKIKESGDDGSVERLKDEVKNLNEKLEKLEKKQDSAGKIRSILQQYKSEGNTLLLSSFVGAVGILGAGHWYVGEKRRAVAFLALGLGIVILTTLLISDLISSIERGRSGTEAIDQFSSATSFLLLLGVAYLILYFWQIVDSRKLCKKHNQRLEQTEL